MAKPKMVKSGVTVKTTVLPKRDVNEKLHKPATKPEAAKNQLQNKAMLVGLSIHSWYPHTTDKKASAKLAIDNNVTDASMVRGRKSLLPREALKTIHSIEAKLRVKHYTLTLPWDDAGLRVLSAAAYLRYVEEIQVLKAEFQAAVEQFIPLYPTFVQSAGIKLGDMHDLADYPPADTIGRRFGVEIIIRSIPDATDFRVDLGDDEVRRIREDIELQQKTSGPMNALRELGVRLCEVVQKAVDKMQNYKVTDEGKIQGTFRDGLFENMKEVVDLLPLLNVLEDSQVTAFGERIKAELAGFAAETLRDDSGLRKKVVTSGQDILSKMGEYFGTQAA